VTVGFHSPLPPARTGVADYSASLLTALRALGTVDVSPAHADVHLYHIGNNGLHRDIYSRALAEPGIVVLHDALLQHLFMGSLDEAGYVHEFVFNYGEWSRDLARELWRGKASSGLRPEYYRYPMLKRLAERSLGVIVHNPAAARTVREHAPDTPVVEIPFLFTCPPPASPAEALRLKQQICQSSFLFGVFGYLRESKRVTGALRAFQRVRAARPNTAFLLAGEFVSPDLALAIEPLLRQPGVVRLGHLPEREFWRVAAATDACINLRYPTAGETSMIAIRFMGIGKPVIVSSGEETAGYPAGACLQVDSGPAEEEMLEQYMLSLRHLPGLGPEIGRRASEYIRRYHSVGHVAKMYWETLCAHRQRA
jgi:glycosyltransferase involved in cell wall biosynthesis